MAGIYNKRDLQRQKSPKIRHIVTSAAFEDRRGNVRWLQMGKKYKRSKNDENVSIMRDKQKIHYQKHRSMTSGEMRQRANKR